MPMTRLTMQRWKHFLSGSLNMSWSSSFSMVRISSSALSFCEIMMYDTQRLARMMADTSSMLSRYRSTKGE